jgi:DNA helicase II / ATP-dependent DNA helicase PcrA
MCHHWIEPSDVHQTVRVRSLFTFTEQQQEVVEQPAGNIAVYAAPGSGKTTVLTAHILHQLTNRLTPPTGMVVVTFTKQSAIELKNRIRQHLSSKRSVEALRIGTFHAQIFRMMMHLTPNIPVVMSTTEQRLLLSHALQREGEKTNPASVDKWMNTIAKLKSCWPSPTPLGKVKRVYQRYEHIKSKSGRWDFDDILYTFCLKIMTTPSVLHEIPAMRYVLVDEFQDTDAIQWTILQQFFEVLGTHLFVVGDDDQCIYEFRGASPQYLLEFPKRVPEAKQFELSCNFRSDRDIVIRASTLIQHNTARVPKRFQVQNTELGECKIFVWKDETQESIEICRMLEAILSRFDDEDISVLARTRRQLGYILNLLKDRMKRRISFHTFHDAKGKEFDTVIVMGAVERNPYLRESPQGRLEEERRLFYVAMTRARHRLYVHVPLRMNGLRTEPSRFLYEAKLL